MKKVYFFGAIAALFLFVLGEALLSKDDAVPAPVPHPSDYKNISYLVQGQTVTLVDGRAEEAVAPGSASKTVTQYFGNEATGDLNGDGMPDVAFLLTQDGGGSGTFYYVVAALKTATGYVGTSAVLLGDRIAPQTTQVEYGQVIVNYADRAEGEPMTTAPSVGVSKYLQVVGNSLTEIPSSEYAAGNLLLGLDGNKLSPHLIGSNGMTLYTYDKDPKGASRCTDACALMWPPYTVATTSVLANLQSGVTGTVGVFTRADGSLQVTYNKKPLYYYSLDAKSGDITGQYIDGVWSLAQP